MTPQPTLIGTILLALACGIAGAYLSPIICGAWRKFRHHRTHHHKRPVHADAAFERELDEIVAHAGRDCPHVKRNLGDGQP